MQMNPHTRIQYYIQCMKDRRTSFEDHWRDIAKYTSPRDYRWLENDWQERGNKANKNIVDPIGGLSARATEAAFSASITPTSRPWKILKARGELGKQHNIQAYLADVSDIMDEYTLSSNFYTEASKVYHQSALYGTAAMIIEEDEETEFRCETLPIGSYWLGIDAKRRVNQFAREIKMTVMQAADMFGEDALSEAHRRILETKQGMSEQITVLHWIGPNPDYNRDPLSRRFRSIYIDPSDSTNPDRALRVGAYDEFPVIAPRWKTYGDDVWGLDCPGMMALGHLQEIQKWRKTAALAAEKMAKPPTLRPEGTARNGVDDKPGGQTVVPRGQASEGVKPLYQINFDINGALAMIDRIQAQVREIFFVNLFMMVANERRSGTKAREIEELHEEKMIVLSTVYEQYSDEFLNPAVNRIYNILLRRGRFPIPPEELQGQQFDVEYVSVMAQAMKLVGIGNMDRALAILSQTAAIDPSVLDIVDLTRFTESYISDRLGVDARVMATAEEREAKAEQRAASQQRAQMQQTASVQADTAKVMSDSKLDEDNALTAMIGRTIG